MTNIIQKISRFLIILIILQVIFAVGNVSHAASFWDNIISAGDNFVSQGQEYTGSEKPSYKQIRDLINDIYSIIFPLGVAVTVIVGAVLGIKFMMASADNKAKVKESLVPYAVGCAVIYGAFAIWRIAILLLSNIVN